VLSRRDRVLLATYLRPQWPRAVALAALLLGGIALQLANPQIARAFIDQAKTGQPFESLIQIALLFLGVVVLMQIASVAETYVAEDLGWRTTNALRADLTRHVLDLDASFHAAHDAGELIERIDGDVLAVADFFARFVVEVIGSGVFLLGVPILLFLADVRIGGLVTCFALAALWFMTQRGGFVAGRSRAAREAAADLSSYVVERLGGLPDIKTSGADAYVMRGLLGRLAGFFHRSLSAAVSTSFFSGSIGLIFVLGDAAGLGLSAALYRADAISLGTIYVVFRYMHMLRVPLDRLSRQMSLLQQAAGGFVRVSELLSLERRLVDGPGANFPTGPLSVDIRGLSFSYERQPVLRNVSLQVEPGAVLALLGRTGSGKTTLSRLLFRLHDPTEGSILLGGVDVRNARLSELRGRIGLVTQDVQLFDGTLRDNLVLFNPEIPDPQVLGALQELGLKEWLRTLPSGLDTLLGATGRGLSAGESQLVALARVFLKDPGLVILDEASSRLDPATERLIERAVDRLLDGRTGVVIAHRLATVGRATHILILEQGQVAERGKRTLLEARSTSRFARLLKESVEVRS
jgi:ATP-binding cassette, subfamily B, bacterial